MNLMRKVNVRDEEVNRMGLYYGFATAFGYTPEQVDNLDVFTLQSFIIISEAKYKEEERTMKQNARRH